MAAMLLTMGLDVYTNRHIGMLLYSFNCSIRGYSILISISSHSLQQEKIHLHIHLHTRLHITIPQRQNPGALSKPPSKQGGRRRLPENAQRQPSAQRNHLGNEGVLLCLPSSRPTLARLACLSPALAQV